MKNGDRVLAAAMAAVMAAGLTACGGGKAPGDHCGGPRGGEGRDEAQAAEETTAAPLQRMALRSTLSRDPTEITFSWWGGDSRHEAT